MATAKVPGDHKVFEVVCYKLMRKSQSFSFLHPTVSELYKNIWVGAPAKVGLKTGWIWGHILRPDSLVFYLRVTKFSMLSLTGLFS